MIQVRNVHQLKFGRIDQAVELFRNLPRVAGKDEFRLHGMTDISGPMYTFVTEMAVPSMADWESMRSSMFERPGYDEWFKEFQLIVDSGQLEMYTIEGEHPGLAIRRR